MTVILESDGFADLLERTEFMQRVSQQDARIIDRVRKAKEEAIAAEKRLDALEERQRKVTAEVAPRAAEVDAIKDRLVDRQQQYQGVAGRKTQRARRHARRTATTSRATSRRSRRSRRRSSRGCQSAQARRVGRPDPRRARAA